MAGGGGGGGAPGDDKNSMAILWIIAGVFIICAIIWLSFAPQLKQLFIKIRVFELTTLYWFFKLLPFQTEFNEIESNLLFAKNLYPGTLTLSAAEYISTFVGQFYRWPMLLIISLLSYFMYNSNIKTRYKKHYDMKKLGQQERIEWPQINPVIDIDLVAADLDTGPWAMGMTPVTFCKQHKLIEVSVMPQLADTLSKGPKFKATLNQAKTEHVFAQQLGRIWRGPDKMPIHRRALLAAFIARGSRDTKTAQNLITQINRSATGDHTKELDFTGADALWKKHYNSRAVQAIVAAHAYEFTFIMGAFLFARQDGVFATSDFMWLKPRDRSFWYVLNSVGRQTPSCEAAAVHSHFLAEKALGRALSVPMVGEATKALQLALNDIIYLPGEEEREQLLKVVSEAEA